MSLATVHAAVVAQRVLAIIRTADATSADAAARRALDAGIASIEVTLTTPGALDVITGLRADYPAAVVGAGTVLDIAAADAATAAGAQFLVSPHLDVALVAYATARDVPAYPGIGSVSELIAGLAAGAPAVKLFPAAVYGPEFIRATLAPLPDAQIMPTGGVTVATAGEWIAAGAVAVGVGSELTRGSADEIGARVQQLLTAVQSPPQS